MKLFTANTHRLVNGDTTKELFNFCGFVCTAGAWRAPEEQAILKTCAWKVERLEMQEIALQACVESQMKRYRFPFPFPP